MSNPTILSLAILKVNWDEPESKDYLENFVPLVGECIRLSVDDVISIAELQQDLKTRFGLNIPQNALRSILNRLKKHDNKLLDAVNKMTMDDGPTAISQSDRKKSDVKMTSNPVSKRIGHAVA
jgi:hypothetical protein